MPTRLSVEPRSPRSPRSRAATSRTVVFPAPGTGCSRRRTGSSRGEPRRPGSSPASGRRCATGCLPAGSRLADGAALEPVADGRIRGVARPWHASPEDGRPPERRCHLPVHGHRGLDAAGQAVRGSGTRRCWPITSGCCARRSQPRRVRGGHAGRRLLRRLLQRPRRVCWRRSRASGHCSRIRGRTGGRSRCGWASTRARRARATVATRGWRFIAPLVSGRRATAGRSLSPRPRRRCSRTRKRTRMSFCATWASSASRTSTGRCGSIRRRADGLPRDFPPPRGEAPLAESCGGGARARRCGDGGRFVAAALSRLVAVVGAAVRRRAATRPAASTPCSRTTSA